MIRCQSRRACDLEDAMRICRAWGDGSSVLQLRSITEQDVDDPVFAGRTATMSRGGASSTGWKTKRKITNSKKGFQPRAWS